MNSNGDFDTICPEKRDEILALIRLWHPDWHGVDDASFVRDETAYKRKAVAEAQTLISQSELERLDGEQDYEEFTQRLDRVGKLNNLLFLSVPTSGDLRVLYHENLDKQGFARAILDLLYGPGPSEQRLQRYADYCVHANLPLYWAFPTLLLFYCYPEEDMFVKPRTMQTFLKLAEVPVKWSGRPSEDLYAVIKRTSQAVLATFEEYGAKDMVDVQSIIWVAAGALSDRTVAPGKQQEFEKLFSEFIKDYPPTSSGQHHMELYVRGREAAKANYEDICRKADAGEDVTDDVLFKLLPYSDNARNRDAGAWISWAPTINGDLKKWYEAAGWTKSEEWPAVAKAILQFVRRCVDAPDELMEACMDFSDGPYSKGFQAGTLTPILNALRPDDFALFNSKSRTVLNHFADTKFETRLTEYPDANGSFDRLQRQLADTLSQGSELGITNGDTFDMFCHWLVAVKQYDFLGTRYWKVSPAPAVPWGEWVEGGFAAIGWDELGDVSSMSKSEFRSVQQARCDENEGWTVEQTDQVWTFAHEIREGDRIVATRGATELLGIGTVTGSYYYVQGANQAHRLPVQWDDVNRREIHQDDWREALMSLDRETFHELANAIIIESELAKPFSEIFADRDEAEWAFELLRSSMDWLGVTAPDDQRCAVTLPAKEDRLLRFNFGPWLALDFRGASRIADIALLADGMDLDEFSHWGFYSPSVAGDLRIRVYQLPYDRLRHADAELREHIEETFRQIGHLFAGRKGSTWRHAHRQQVMDAVFDKGVRNALLTNGLVPDGSDEPAFVVNPDCPFTTDTIDLLAQLAQNPTAAFYQEHKDEFIANVEEPFKRVMLEVGSLLPPEIQQVMEVKQRIFGRFTKNDFGQGGAWPFYWGAFYPIGSKRSQDAQLSMWMDYQFLECGFYIGEYGSDQRSRFTANCRKHAAVLKEILWEALSNPELLFGPRETFKVGEDGLITQERPVAWQDFLDKPDEHYPDISVVIPAHELLQMSESELIEKVRQTHISLFPLVILATHSDPLPAIQRYLDEDEAVDELPVAPPYSLADCAAETGLDEATLSEWVRAIHRKRQAILYGPPGTGKTYLAERLAKHLIADGDGILELVQFHPSYAYEDFIQGIRPSATADGQLTYQIVPGRFLEFCRDAEERSGISVLILDEINRANLSRVFGELMYLLEYRDRAIPLAGGGRLKIPANVRILGTMNTADRSIALVDHALRRRFAFIALYPDYELLKKYHQSRKTGFPIENLVRELRELNNAINDQNYQVGITFFLREDLDSEIRHIWRMEIEPYLEEYFFDRPERVRDFRWDRVHSKLRG